MPPHLWSHGKSRRFCNGCDVEQVKREDAWVPAVSGICPGPDGKGRTKRRLSPDGPPAVKPELESA